VPEDESPVYEIAEPRPSAMIESLRAVGYSLPTAVADLVDNSIAALAQNVWIHFEWNGSESYVSIRDDGHGMDEKELVNAMTLGSRSPLEARGYQDLGRFGLGLKTASFSQCRKLIVRSQRAAGQASLRCWDLDYVSNKAEWRLLKQVDTNNSGALAAIDTFQSGTVVLWEILDRLVSATANISEKRAHTRFLESIRDVERHLAMVFHRFLERRNPLRIWINGNLIEPWDPFLKSETATQSLPEEVIQLSSGIIRVSPYVLPHHSKLSEDVFKLASGVNGWNAQQGFYVYRNERLLVPGHWLGFGFQKEEHYKLARIQVDVPTSMDFEWAIDVKKSRARPPADAREPLRKLARLTREVASGIYRNKGRIIGRTISDDFVFIWLRHDKQGKISYKINREHPLVLAALSGSQDDKSRVNALLRLVEETVPKEQIWIDNQESLESRTEPFEGAERREIESLLDEIYSYFSSNNMASDLIRERLCSMEPFSRFPELVERVCNRRGRH